MSIKRYAIRLMIALNFIGVTEQSEPMCVDPAFQKEVSSYLIYTVPTISVAELYQRIDDVIILDAREIDEYNVSSINQSIYIGSDDFDINRIRHISKDAPLVVYCSIGYRSEKVGEKLLKAGYTEVYNLYGGIFEWVNQHHPVIQSTGDTTNQIHTYNRKWSKWVGNAEMQKIY